MPEQKSEQRDNDVAVVKKYANRRLYNTATSSYVTLDELSQMVRDGGDFVVYDAKSGDDITRSVLTQIILEEDGKGRNLLPTTFLRQLIGYYDDSLHALLPRYLELSMENFARNQDQFRDYVESTFGRFFPIKQRDAMMSFEGLTRQNMALMQKAATMFSPFQEQEDGASMKEPKAQKANQISEDVQSLRNQIELLQKQLEDLKLSRNS